MLYYFKKGKNTTETQKKFHAGDFLLDDAPQVDQLKLIAIKLRH